MTLTEFLLARLAADEALAREVKVERDDDPNATNRGSTLWHADGNIGDAVVACEPSRALAEVAAKRGIVEWHYLIESTCRCEFSEWDNDNPETPCPTLRSLASVYADHPDFDPTWAP